MRKKSRSITTARSLSTCLIFFACGQALAQDYGDPLAAENFSSTLYFTTDYVFRGVSFTSEDPAIQGSFDYTHPSGAYAGLWGSNWDGFGTESELEIDYYLGYANTIGDVGYDLTALYYTFPGAEDDGFELDYFEAHAGLSYAIEPLPFTPTVGVGYNYSPDYNGEDGDSHYVNGAVDLALPVGFGLGFGVGNLNVAGGALSAFQGGFSYTHYYASLSKSIHGFDFNLTYHDTTSQCEDEYGGPILLDRSVCTPGAVFTLSRTF
ncbi:MAG: TorF family putative porin [Gammaproteobacteria bacterium]